MIRLTQSFYTTIKSRLMRLKYSYSYLHSFLLKVSKCFKKRQYSLIQETEIQTRLIEEKVKDVEHGLRNISDLLKIFNNKLTSLECMLQQNSLLIQYAETRTRTLEHQLSLTLGAVEYQNDFLLNWYSEFMPNILKINKNALFNAPPKLILLTKHPLATKSNDYINPESTLEGLVRPTKFVRHCLEILGEKINLLDLGTGAAGLVFECLANRLFAVGVDGSDFCARYSVGYWPLLKNNLFHCDITKPFLFQVTNSKDLFCFNVITMWEVLEHIHEIDLDILFQNIFNHLAVDGYFIGSVSLIKYVDENNKPYHVTLKPKQWWAEKFYQHGLLILDKHPFDEKFFCRGVGKRFQDHYNYFSDPEHGFHFVATKLTT